MPRWLSALLSWLLSRFFGKTPAPSRVEVLSREAATSETKLAETTQAVKTEAAISKAIVDAPKDTAAVVAELRGGEF